jgi:hypothetical protein
MSAYTALAHCHGACATMLARGLIPSLVKRLAPKYSEATACPVSALHGLSVADLRADQSVDGPFSEAWYAEDTSSFDCLQLRMRKDALCEIYAINVGMYTSHTKVNSCK